MCVGDNVPTTTIRSRRRIPVYVWVPPSNYPNYKIIIRRRSGYVDDVTDYILNGYMSNQVTEGIGSFRFTIDNSTSRFYNVWSGNETVYIYADYTTNPTNTIFRGIVEKVYYGGYYVHVYGRSSALPLLYKRVTRKYDGIAISTILKSLISDYAPGFTTSNVQTCTTTLTVNWYQKPFWDCVKQLCYASGYDCYVDANNDFHFFQEKTIENTVEAVVHGINLLETGDFGRDYSQVRNKVTVYGATIDDVPIVYTATDQDSYNEIGRWQEEIITDTNIRTVAEARDRAIFELNRLKDPPIVGTITSLGLPTLMPGEMLRISDPDNGLAPGTYKVLSLEHTFRHGDIMQTKVTIEKFSPSVPTMMKARIEAEQQLSDTPNPYELEYSWIITFDDETDTGSHNNTEIASGRLKLVSGASSGTWISTTTTATNNITKAQVKAAGNNITQATFYISNNNGATWQTVTLNDLTTLSSTGNKLKIKVVINSSNVEIDTIGILYS